MLTSAPPSPTPTGEDLRSAHGGRRPRVAMVGLRGVPDVEGGVERHVEQLSRHLVDLGYDIHVMARAAYVQPAGDHQWAGISVHPAWAPRSGKLEALVHTALAVVSARRLKPDLIHFHAVGPSLFVPLARLLGLPVVVTHHGFDYDREKWSAAEKLVLKLGERFAMTWSQARIAVSPVIAERMREDFGVDVDFIPNAVKIDKAPDDPTVLDAFGLRGQRYLICVGRLVPEKRQSDIITAFRALGDPGVKLVLVGSGDETSAYVQRLRQMASETPGVVMTGQQRGEDLAALFQNASLFVLPSSHEGMPIVMLEALAHGLPVVASDIPANLAVKLDSGCYFKLGDTEALRQMMRTLLDDDTLRQKALSQRQVILDNYSWRAVAEATAAVYRTVL